MGEEYSEEQEEKKKSLEIRKGMASDSSQVRIGGPPITRAGAP